MNGYLRSGRLGSSAPGQRIHQSTSCAMSLERDFPTASASRPNCSQGSLSICVDRGGVTRRLRDRSVTRQTVSTGSPSPQDRSPLVRLVTCNFSGETAGSQSRESGRFTRNQLTTVDTTKPRQAWTASAGLRTDELRRTTVTASLLVATEQAQGVTYTPTCDAHRVAATFAIEFEDFDGEGRRELYCRDCIADGIEYTATNAFFTPPTISRITVPVPLAWRCAKCDGDPDTCPVVNGRCVREVAA